MDSTNVTEGDLLWEPSGQLKSEANISRFLQFISNNKKLRFDSYEDLWKWSVASLEDFWESVWEFNGIQASQPYNKVLSQRKMPGAQWFVGAKLNYVEQVFRWADLKTPALKFQSEIRPLTEISWSELSRKVASVATALRNMGVKCGDRVVAYLPNIPETIIAFLACASIGAVWSSCSPDFGFRSVTDRFRQIEPKVLFAVDGYQYGGKKFDCEQTVATLQKSLPTLEHTILVPYLYPQKSSYPIENFLMWDDIIKETGALTSNRSISITPCGLYTRRGLQDFRSH